jgi:hypothetical protein
MQFGWRRYSLTATLTDGYLLTGMRRAWYGRDCTAECLAASHYESAYDDLQSIARDHLQRDDGGHPGDNSCGIYAVPEADQLVTAIGGFGQVEAGVSYWGIVAHYELGVRAEVVRIEHIRILGRYYTTQSDADRTMIANNLRQRYEVEVEWDDEIIRGDLERGFGWA